VGLFKRDNVGYEQSHFFFPCCATNRAFVFSIVPAQLSDPYVPSKQPQVRLLLPHPKDNSMSRVTFLSPDTPTVA
jgi:hypothetical protein